MLNNVLMPEYPQIVSLPASPEGVVAQLETYRRQFLREAESVEKAAQAGNAAELQAFRDGWLGRKQGLLAQLNEHWLKPAPGEAKKLIGQQLNRLRGEAEAAMERIEAVLEAARLQAQLASETLDVTLPARAPRGASHPLTQVTERILGIFHGLGYSLAEGPEMESAWYNFDALNIPESHPARDDQDTLYLGPDLPGHLLRTHTSPGQIRVMEQQAPPLRVAVPGRVYRRDAPDATHSPMFHQVEGLAVDEDLSFADLKGTLEHFARAMFGAATRTRFRASYFPFTEPSAEMDASCFACAGSGCRTCKNTGWIEVLGCGMVHPEVFRAVAKKNPVYETGKWRGFAFGMGVERMAMILYGLDDIQRFYSGDLRFLEQFAAHADGA